MKTEFTPGPWIIDTINGEPDGQQDTVIEYQGFPICRVRGTDDMSCIDVEDEEKIASECIANARLIAAAPSLLEALESVLRLRRLIEYTDITNAEHEGEAIALNQMIYKAEQAIQLARGITKHEKA